MKYSVTITRKYLFIGCQQIKRTEVKKFTKLKAEKAGLPKEYYAAYKQMIEGAMKLVKNK